MNITVLTKSYWQFASENIPPLPRELEPSKELFEKFYKEKHKQGREL